MHLDEAVVVLESATAEADSAEVREAAAVCRTTASAGGLGESTDRLLAIVNKFHRERVKGDIVTALYIVLLRAGDQVRLTQVANVRPMYLVEDPLVWALGEGAVSPVAYRAVLGLRERLKRCVAPAGEVGLLARHVRYHPERLSEVLPVLTEHAPDLTLPFLCRVIDASWPGDPTPAIPFLLEAPADAPDVEATLFMIGRERNVDLAALRQFLEKTLGSPHRGAAAGWLLGRHELGREPVHWDALDAVCRHQAAPARIGALRALACTWLRRDVVEVPPRLAAALVDGAPTVREEARRLLVDGLRRARPLGHLDPDIDRLLGDTGCRLCRYLRPEDWWGEQMGDRRTPWINRDPPPELRRLERLGELDYRCPLCGARFHQKQDGGEWLNNEWTYFWLERRGPTGA